MHTSDVKGVALRGPGCFVAIFVLVVVVLVGLGWTVSRHRAALAKQADRLALNMTLAFTHPDAGTFERAAAKARGDDWPTFAHDERRSGLETTDTGINRATAGNLRLRWMHSLGASAVSSPLAVGGSVYAATSTGDVVALDAATGRERWRRHVGNSVHMTPAVVGNSLLVGDYGQFGRVGEKPRGSAFTALDTATGAVRWRTELPGLVRSEPVVLGSTIYEGLAGGDSFSGCFNGRIITLDLKTGRKLPAEWMTVPGAHDDGGGIWSPLSTDGRQIDAGTGNSCSRLGGAGYGDALVGLDPSGLRTLWHVPTFVPNVDDSDVGGGVMIAGDRGYAAGKSGYLYVVNRLTGKLLFRYDLKPYARNGGSIATPTSDGIVVIVSSGELTDPWDKSFEQAGGDLVALDRDANERYRIHSNYAIHGYVAFVPGVGFTALDRKLVAFDSSNGTILWRGPLDDVAYASPAVVPSGVYIVTNHGTVFAYGLP